MDPKPRVAVIGGGIAGLAAAFRLHESATDLSVTVYEAASRIGGIVESVVREGFLIERSADSFITDPPHAVELCRRLGLADDLIPTATTGRRALVLCRNELLPVPEGFVIMAPSQIGPLIRSPLLSYRGKLRALEEPLVPPRSSHLPDESVADFARRRFGLEAYERLIQPLVGGIYTGDPECLSMAATMSRFWNGERDCGSVIRAERISRDNSTVVAGERISGARYGKFLSLRRGLGAVMEAIDAALPPGTVKLSHRVTALKRDKNCWHVTFRTQSGTFTKTVDAVVIAAPAAAAAQLLPDELASRLRSIESAGASVVCLGYRREHVAHALDAFGFVVPKVEGRQILAGSFLSTKFADRAPHDKVLLRIFVGGALQPELVDLPDDRLLELVERELRELLGISGPPVVLDIARWHGAMPQYDVGHLQLVDEIERLVAAVPGLALAGNAYRGVGITQCVKSGEDAAGRVIDLLARRESIR